MLLRSLVGAVVLAGVFIGSEARQMDLTMSPYGASEFFGRDLGDIRLPAIWESLGFGLMVLALFVIWWRAVPRGECLTFWASATSGLAFGLMGLSVVGMVPDLGLWILTAYLVAALLGAVARLLRLSFTVAAQTGLAIMCLTLIGLGFNMLWACGTFGLMALVLAVPVRMAKSKAVHRRSVT